MDTAVGALFVPKNIISIKEHVSVPLDSAWEKAYEFKIDLDRMEHIEFAFEKNTATFYDSLFSNVLFTTSEFSFLKFKSALSSKLLKHEFPDWAQMGSHYNKTLQPYTIRGGGKQVMSFSFKLEPTQTNWFRKQIGAWEFLASLGGFALAALFLGRMFYE